MTEFKSRGLAEAEFEQYYQKQMYPKLCELEQIRLKYKRRFIYLLILISVLTPLLLIISYQLLMSGVADKSALKFFDEYTMPIVLGLIVLIFILSGPFSDYRREMKNGTMKDLAHFFGNFHYTLGKCLDDRILENSKLIGSFNRHYGDDYFEGEYNDVKIVVSEEMMQQESGHGKHRVIVTKFNGVLIRLQMNKKFSGQTVVLRDWGIFNKLHLPFDKLQKVALEDVRFEREFEVYSDNQIEARYVLTTAFMERMIKLKKAFRGKKIRFSFFDNQVLIAVSTSKNLFEPGSLFTSILSRARMANVFNQFYSVLSVVDILKLNIKTGL